METGQGVETLPLCLLFPAPGSFLLAILAAGLGVVGHGAAWVWLRPTILASLAGAADRRYAETITTTGARLHALRHSCLADRCRSASLC